MKTIVQIVQHLQPGGIETLSLDLSSFSENEERVFIISLEGDYNSSVRAWPRLEQYKDRLFFLDKQPGIKLSIIYQLITLFRKLRADVIQTHHIGPLLYAGMAARLYRTKHLIHTEHDAWHLKDAKHLMLQRWALRLFRPVLVADAAIVANTMKSLLHSNLPINIIRNGIDTKKFIPGSLQLARKKLKLPDDKKIIGCSGRLERVKGQSILIESLSYLPDNIHLALAGIGSTENELRQRVADLELSHRVHFLGRIDEMPIFYQSLDAFCLPSFNEGLPLSPLEAQACNIPTVVTDVGGACETLCSDSGQSIPAGDAKIMATTLQKILFSTQSTQPRVHIEKHFDVRHMIQSYRRLFVTGE